MVSGPGLIHALGGMANANMNCWYSFIHQLESLGAVYSICTSGIRFLKEFFLLLLLLGLLLSLEGPQIETRKQQVPFRSFPRS